MESSTSPAVVTVVVPLHNGAAHIHETLTSIMNQTRRPAEVIVVDDGSSDDGPRIAREHPVGATVVSQPNLGVAVTRNHGLSMAAGRWIAFLDQDDLWHPRHLEHAVGWLEENPGERIVFMGETAFTAEEDAARLSRMDALAGGWAERRVPATGAYDALVDGHVTGDAEPVRRHTLRDMLRGPISMTTSFVADPQLLRLAGGFAPHALAMDDYFLLVNASKLAPIAQTSQHTVFYRVHTAATSRSTRLGLPFLSSAIALRLGGGLLPAREGMTADLAGGLHRHVLDELLASPEYRQKRMRLTVDSLARLVWPPAGMRGARWRARAAAHLPWARAAWRAIRRRARGIRRRPDAGGPPS